MNNTFSAEVIASDISYKQSTDENGNVYPRGTIKFRSRTGATGAMPIEDVACPLNANDFEIPLVGEHIIISSATSDASSVFKRRTKFYYTKSVNIQDSLNSNVLPSVNAFRASENRGSQYKTKSMSNVTSGITEQTIQSLLFTHNTNTITFLQPYEGDRILQSRHGSAIRFTSTILGNTSVYDNQPSWQGTKSGDPAVLITAGPAGSSGYYSVEDINKDKCSIYLLSNQKLTISTKPIYSTIVPLSTYTGAQNVIASDRLVFISKKDSIILSSETTVAISTKNWKTDLDKLFTILEQTLQQLADLTSGKAQFQTPMGGPTLTATNVTQVQKLLTELKTMKQ